MIEIRRADLEEIPKIMSFIDEHWKKDHILSKSVELFNWQYVDGDICNVVIAIDNDTKEIYGINGFIKYNSLDKPDISGAIWKVIKNPNPILGLEMAEYVGDLVQKNFTCGIGLNPKTSVRLARMSGDNVEKLDHFYRLSDQKEYHIAVVKNKKIIASKNDNYNLVQLKNFETVKNILSDEILRSKKPYKDLNYIKHRYFDHPMYKYLFYGIDIGQGEINSILVTREVNVLDRKILKIVDFFGVDNDLRYISTSLEKLLLLKKYEFVDLYCCGIDRNILFEAGFNLRDDNDENIIPNYFEPFEQKNVEIYYGASTLENLYMYRGDGDQDRPNLLK